MNAKKSPSPSPGESSLGLDQLLNNLPGMAYRCLNDRDWTMIVVSDGCLPITGYERNELLNNRVLSFGSIVHPEDSAWLWSKCQAALDARTPCNNEYRIIAKSGAMRWVRERATGVYDAAGALQCIEGFVQDITALKDAETALLTRESLFRTLTEVSPVGIYRADASGQASYLNARCCEIIGNSAELSRGHGWSSTVHPEDRERVFEGWKQAVAAKRSFISEHRFLHGDGRLVWGANWSQPEVDAAGEIVGHVGVLIDITARKQAEEAKQESESALLEAQRVAQIGNWSWEIASNVVHWSAEMFRIYHRDPDSAQLSYEEQLKFYTPESAARLHAVVARAMETGAAYELDLERACDGGPKQWITARGEALRDASGRIVMLRGTAQDITARKLAETALKESDQRFRDLVDSTDGIIWEADAVTFCFTRVSDNAERLLGHPVADWLQPGFWSSHIYAEDRDQAVEYCAERSRRSEDHDFEYRFVAAGGRIVWLRDIVRVVSENGKPRWLRGLMIDITAQKKTGEALLMSLQEKAVIADQLRQSQKLESLGTLAGGIAHDFNNILAGISGFNSLARQAVGNATEQLDYLGEIELAAQRAAKLVQQILAFSRTDSQARIPMQMRHVVVEAIQLLRATLPSSIEFTINLATDLPPVLGNATQLHQVVMNLGTNAWHAMREKGGQLGVSLEACTLEDPVALGLSGLSPGPCLRLIVSDNGSGMSAVTMKRVFDPFFTTKNPGEGSGLGLSVLHGIVHGHQGAVRLTSELGHGTTFEVYLPIIAAATLSPETVVPDNMPRGRGERILFVDDEPGLVRMGLLILSNL